MGSELEQFLDEGRRAAEIMAADEDLRRVTREWFDRSCDHRYTYNFTWMGRPVIQYPQDLLAMQEIIWRTKPDLIIETGVAHGGSLIFYASLFELMGAGKVLGVELEVRPHNKKAIAEHPMAKRIQIIEGSSTAPAVVDQVRAVAKDAKRVMVVLDSNHTHAHVLDELRAYAPLVSKDQYLVVFDTVVEDMDTRFFKDRPWGKGNNPKTAVWEFLKGTKDFVIDREVENRLLITVAPDGYLRRVG